MEADGLAEFFRVEHAAVGYHPGNPAKVLDVAQRVAVHEDEVGTLARFDRAGVLIELHDSG